MLDGNLGPAESPKFVIAPWGAFPLNGSPNCTWALNGEFLLGMSFPCFFFGLEQGCQGTHAYL